MAVPDGVDEVLDALPPIGKMRYVMLTVANSALMIQERDSLIEELPELAETTAGRGASLTPYYQFDQLDDLLKTMPADIEIVRPERTNWYGIREVAVFEVIVSGQNSRNRAPLSPAAVHGRTIFWKCDEADTTPERPGRARKWLLFIKIPR